MRSTLLAISLLFACTVGALAAGPAQTSPASTHTVLIKGFMYQPTVLTVKAGDTVEWKNADIVPHTVTADDKSFTSGSIAPGASWKYTAKKAGSFSYSCTPHPNMKATLIVQ